MTIGDAMKSAGLVAALILGLAACDGGCGDADDEEVPEAERPEIRVIQFGTYHFCALDEHDKVWCAGRNDKGQLGDGTTVAREALTEVTGLGEMTGLAVGLFDTTCAWNEGGDLYCWGSNTDGIMGEGEDEVVRRPTRIEGLPPVVDVAVGGFHLCALTEGDEVYCWGRNDKGQVGVGRRMGEQVETPQMVTIPDGARAVDVGGESSCAVNHDGDLFCWGSNAQGQLGLAVSDVAAVTLPEPVVFLPGPVEALDVGFRHACILVGERRRLYCWGDNSQGQLGLGDREQRTEPVEIAEMAYAEELALAAGQTCARVDDAVYCAGQVSGAADGGGAGLVFEPNRALQRTGEIWGGGLAICGLADGTTVACRGIDPGAAPLGNP